MTEKRDALVENIYTTNGLSHTKTENVDNLIKAISNIFYQRYVLNSSSQGNIKINVDLNNKIIAFYKNYQSLQIGEGDNVVNIVLVFDFFFKEFGVSDIDVTSAIKALGADFIAIFSFKNIADNIEKIIPIRIDEHVFDTSIKRFENFIYISEFDLNTNIKANEYVSRIIFKMGKIIHLLLSENSAKSYDESYGKTAFGTGIAMLEEEELLKKVLTVYETSEGRIAIDMGCGTGRHSIVLSKYFENVRAYDISKNMVDFAKKKAEMQGVSNITFNVVDVEEASFENIENESIDFVLASFGLGSFIENLPVFLKKVMRKMKENGKIFLSFYNKEALNYTTRFPWNDASLNAKLVIEKNELEVSLANKQKYNIFCKAYAYEDLQTTLENIFGKPSVELSTYSVLATFLSNQLFQDEHNDVLKDVVQFADKEIRKKYNIGFYIIAICSKKKSV
jgi:ubiquinone/menaquinone biosynthesis C-methylase UbiE